MGQGTLTGLAQLVAEELDCDWSKVTTEYPSPGQSVKRKRAWGAFSTGGSRGIRESHEYVRAGRRSRQTDADPGRGQRVECAGVGMQRVQQHDHAHVRQQDHLRQGCRSRRQARGAEGPQAQGSEGLEDRRQAAQAARHRRQGRRPGHVRHRLQDAGHAQRRDPDFAGVRRNGEELRRGHGRQDARRQEGGEGRRERRRRRRRHLVARQDRGRGIDDRLGHQGQ